jgi:sugar O-acyltransferase (sialic acid O-acetyltransferase NeuD family)
MPKNLIIFGTGDTAEIAFDYFMNESDFRVVAFTVDDRYMKSYDFLGCPVVPFSLINHKFNHIDHSMFIAIGYKSMNRLRAIKYKEALWMGYNLASFISPYAYVGRNVKIGSNCFIMEKNNIQYGCTIGNDVLMWASNHIGHGSTIKDHVYISSNVTIGGFCTIGEYSFLGINSTVSDKSMIRKYNLIGANTFVSGETYAKKIYSVKSEKQYREFNTLFGENNEMFNPDLVMLDEVEETRTSL